MQAEQLVGAHIGDVEILVGGQVVGGGEPINHQTRFGRQTGVASAIHRTDSHHIRPRSVGTLWQSPGVAPVGAQAGLIVWHSQEGCPCAVVDADLNQRQASQVVAGGAVQHNGAIGSRADIAIARHNECRGWRGAVHQYLGGG